MELQEILQNFDTLPPPANLQNWVDGFDAMAVHTRKKTPDKLLNTRRPNETEEVFAYRKANYRPITYGSMNRAFNNLYRIFQTLNYSIVASDDLKEYIKQNIFKSENLESYFQKYVLKRMIEDANGLLVWLPIGEGIIDNSQKVNPIPELIYSSDIKYISDEFLIYKSLEYKYFINKKLNQTTPVFYILDKTKFYKYYKTTETTYNLEEIYLHNIGEVPYIITGGDMNADGFYDSYFSPYLAFGDEAINQFSDWQAIMVTCGFPAREELEVDCTNQGCVNGMIMDKKNNIKNRCSVCGGTGKIVAKSPYGSYKRKLPDKLDTNAPDNANVPSLRFISPDVNILRYSGESWEKLILMAEKTLQLNYINEAQSGVAKDIDREELYALLTKIGNNYFDRLLLQSLQYIEKYRNIAESKEITILKPFDFKINSEADILANIDSLTKSNTPDVFLSESIKELSNKRFSGNPTAMKIIDTLMIWDKLYLYSVADKSQMMLENVITKDEYKKSLIGNNLINRLILNESSEWFLEASYDEIAEELDSLYEATNVKEEVIPLIDETEQQIEENNNPE